MSTPNLSYAPDVRRLDDELMAAVLGMMEPERLLLAELVDNEHFKTIARVADELHAARVEMDAELEKPI